MFQVMMDFETAERNAWKEVFGDENNHDICGCNFHFCQAVIKWIKDHGYIAQFRRIENKPLRGNNIHDTGFISRQNS